MAGTVHWVSKVPAGIQVDSRAAVPSVFMSTGPLAAVSATSVPNLLQSRLEANESAAQATLRNIATAQAQFRSIRAADRDNDGRGEFGFFGELSGSKQHHAARVLWSSLHGICSLESGGKLVASETVTAMTATLVTYFLAGLCNEPT